MLFSLKRSMYQYTKICFSSSTQMKERVRALVKIVTSPRRKKIKDKGKEIKGPGNGKKKNTYPK